MGDGDANTAAPAERTNWPILTMLIVIIAFWALTAALTVALDGRNTERGLAQGALFAVPLSRVLVAILRREQSRTWIAYLAAAVLILPLWVLVLESVFRGWVG